MKKKITLLLLSSLVSLSQAQATNVSSNLNSSASIAPKCTISGNKIDFGDISPRNLGFVSVNSILKTICTKSTSYTIIIGAGETGDILNRKLKGNTAGNNDKLNYTIYDTSSFKNILGDGTNGTMVISGTGTGKSEDIVIYGYLNLKQYISPDYYSDSLSVIINY